MLIKTEVEISLENVAGLLCSAFEGGIGYWAFIDGYVNPAVEDEWTAETFNWPSYVTRALSKGGAVLLIEDSGDGDKPRKRKLTLSKVKKGLQVMAKKYPRHFSNFIQENYDSETGDVFVQCAVLGDCIYG